MGGDEQDQISIDEVEDAHTEQALEYINNPRNVGILRYYDGKGEKAATLRGRTFRVVIYLKVQEDTIRQASYFSDSLGGLIHAYGSALTEMVKGKTIREALWIRPEDVSDALGLPETGFGAWFKKALLEAINDCNRYRAAPWKKAYERQ